MAYDVLLLMQELNELPPKVYITALPKNSERLRSLRIGPFEVMDSLSHLQAGLGKLTETLKSSDHDYGILRQSRLCNKLIKVQNQNGKVIQEKVVFQPQRFDLLLKKGYFPFNLATSASALLEITEFPPKADFYDKLTKEIGITDEEYEFAKHVFTEFECKNLMEYALIYCETDTILLAECLFRYRQMIEEFAGLDAFHYLSLPSIALDAFLLQTNCHLELFSSSEMFHFIEQGIIGEIKAL